MPQVTQLPYYGPHRESFTQRARANTVEIPFADLHAYEQSQVDHDVNELADPLAILEAKVEHLAELLGCSEEHAERVLLKRIGSKI